MNELQWGFVFHNENCIQCYGCEAACKMWRSIESGVKWRRVINTWDGEYPDVTCSTVSVSCQHCAEPTCVEACPSNAISKRDSDGLVLVDRDKCTGCQACLTACQFDVPQFGADGLMQKCDMCLSDNAGTPKALADHPPCVATCPTSALERVQLSASEKIVSEQNILSKVRNNK